MSSQYSLTQSQSLIWAGARLAPEIPLYESVFTFEILGPLDPAAFCRAFDRLIEQNDALRMRVAEELSGPVPTFIQSGMPGCELVDLSDRPAEVSAWITERMQSVLDPGKCMFDCVLAKTGEQRYCWYMSMHHLITDGANVQLMLREQEALYLEETDNQQDKQEPAARNKFAQFLLQEESRRNKTSDKRAKTWWRERESPREPSRLYNRNSQEAGWRQVRIARQLGAMRSEALAALAKSRGFRALTPELSLFNVFATALATFIHRMENRERLCFGVTTNGRRTAIERETVGLFMQILPFQLKIRPEQTFREVSKLVAAENIGFLTNAYPEAANSKSLSAFDIALNFIPTPLNEFAGLPCKTNWRHTGYGDKGRKMSVTVEQFNGSDFEILFDFATAAVTEEGRESAMRHFIAILDCMLEDPDAAVGEANFLSLEELARQRIALEHGCSDPPSRVGKTLWAQFEEVARRAPNSLALEHGTVTESYRELHQEALKLADKLKAAGCKRGQIIPVVGDRSSEFIRSILAIQAADAVFLPIDASNPPARIDAILADSRSPFYLRCEEQSVTLAKCSPTNDSQELQPDAAYVMYTSGSTGTPKGAIVGQNSVSYLLEDVERKSALTSDARCSWWTNIGFDVAIYEIFTALLYGRCLCIPSNETRLDTKLLFGWLVEQSISIAYLPPFFVDAFAAFTTQHPNKVLRRILVGVEPIRESSLSRILENCSELQILNGYGPTESTVCATIAKISRSASGDAPAPIGKPVLGTKCKILSSSGASVPLGVVGELFLGGAGRALGYLHSAELTNEKFVRVPSGDSDEVYFQTGDLVRLRADNQLEYVGRVDDQLKFNGVRIDPVEIQQVITAVHAVEQCHVMLIESGEWRNNLVACFTVQDADASPSEEELRRVCSERLPRNMIPRQFVHLDTLPRTQNGKIDREKLSSIIDSELVSRNRREDRPEATSEIQKQLQEIWCEVLKRDSIAIDDDLFGLGGDSMSVIQIVTLAGQLGLNVKSSTIFQQSTIRRLAARLEQQQVSVSPLLEKGTSPQLTLIQRWFFEQPMVNRDHWNHVVTIRLQEDVHQVALQTAIAAVFTRHEALQMRFFETDGEWTPIRRDQSEPGNPVILLGASEEELHARISIQDGPLWAASISEGSLILVVHHLAVDAVSWRVLLQELVAQYECIQNAGKSVVPNPAPTPSAWVQTQREYLSSSESGQHRKYWQKRLASNPQTFLDRHQTDETNAVGREVARFGWDQDRSARFDEVCEKSKRFSAREVLLTALADVIANGVSGQSVFRIDLEGHGRNSGKAKSAAAVDPASIVGWLTALHPFIFNYCSSDDALTRLLSIQQQMEDIPLGGWSYGAIRYLSDKNDLEDLKPPSGEVLFNYLGDTSFADSNALWRDVSRLELSCGKDEHLGYPIEVNVFWHQGWLRFEWRFDRRIVSREIAQGLISSFELKLEELMGALADDNPSSRRLASDFPLAGLDDRKLGQLAKALGKSSHRGGR